MEEKVVETIVPVLLDCDARNEEHKQRPPPFAGPPVVA